MTLTGHACALYALLYVAICSNLTRRETSPKGKRSKSRARAGEAEAGADVQEADPLRPRPDTVLSFLKSLWVARVDLFLDVRNFRLVAWPPEVKNAPDITRMHIDNNELRAVPDEVCDIFPAVSPSVCVSTSMPSCASLCVHAHAYVRLSGCMHTRADAGAPSQVKFVTKLTLLTMDSNQIKSVSPELGSLTLLKQLSIAHNALEVISVSIYVTKIVAHFWAQISPVCTRRIRFSFSLVMRVGTHWRNHF
jgi:hypothetical protein